MQNTRNQKAFTLVELVMVIVIIGLLAAVVTPKFASIKTEAQNAAELGTAAAVRSGVNLSYMQSLAQGGNSYPASLDTASNAAASASNPLFTTVIEGGVTDGNWTKTAANTYRYTPTNATYTYTPADGKLTKS